MSGAPTPAELLDMLLMPVAAVHAICEPRGWNEGDKIAAVRRSAVFLTLGMAAEAARRNGDQDVAFLLEQLAHGERMAGNVFGMGVEMAAHLDAAADDLLAHAQDIADEWRRNSTPVLEAAE
jgi:hypothetical protein